jgi:hypothetical protein
VKTPPKNIETRAVGGPPEEPWSEDPNEQAEAILEASEDHLEEGTENSIGRTRPDGSRQSDG